MSSFFFQFNMDIVFVILYGYYTEPQQTNVKFMVPLLPAQLMMRNSSSNGICQFHKENKILKYLLPRVQDIDDKLSNPIKVFLTLTNHYCIYSKHLMHS